MFTGQGSYFARRSPRQVFEYHERGIAKKFIFLEGFRKWWSSLLGNHRPLVLPTLQHASRKIDFHRAGPIIERQGSEIHRFMKALVATLLLLTFLTQALPLSGVGLSAESPKCAVSCPCHAEAHGCCCIDLPSTPEAPLPVNSPPLQGRDLLPAALWIAEPNVRQPEPIPDGLAIKFAVRPLTGLSSIRLSVLFCSILI